MGRREKWLAGITQWVPNALASLNQLFDDTEFIYSTLTGDDKGTQIKGGQFSVGEPGDGYESVFGEGDSYPCELAFHFDGVSTYTDVTAILASDAASTVGLFGGTTAGRIIYVGSDYIYRGVKAKINTLGDVNPDNIIAEFWTASGWTEAPFMVTDSEFPYTQKADNLCTCSSCSEHWRFMFDPDLTVSPWIKNTVNGVEKYWGRFRIVTDITTDPIIEQIKHHTNRMEINADGAAEYFGRSRYPKDLLVHLNLASTLGALAPGDSDIDISPNIILSLTGNKLLDTKIDGFGGILEIPEGLDTSIPIIFEVVFIPLDTNTGDVDLEFISSQSKLGDIFDGTLPETSIHVQETMDGTAFKSYKIRTRIDARKVVPGDFIAVGIKRDAGAGNGLDTYAGDVSIIKLKAIGHFWRP